MWFMNDQHQLSQWNEIQSNQSDRIMCAVLFAPLLCQQPWCWIFFHQAKLSKSSTASTCARKPRRVAIQKMINMSTNSGLWMQHLQGTQEFWFLTISLSLSWCNMICHEARVFCCGSYVFLSFFRLMCVCMCVSLPIKKKDLQVWELAARTTSISHLLYFLWACFSLASKMRRAISFPASSNDESGVSVSVWLVLSGWLQTINFAWRFGVYSFRFFELL